MLIELENAEIRLMVLFSSTESDKSREREGIVVSPTFQQARGDISVPTLGRRRFLEHQN